MKDGLMDDAAIGQYFAGSSARTGRRFREEEWTGSVYVVRGRRYIRRSDLEEWLEGRKIELAAQPTDLKATLKKISENVLAKRRAS